jgi:mono/diheme cytochrome c family protein
MYKVAILLTLGACGGEQPPVASPNPAPAVVDAPPPAPAPTPDAAPAAAAPAAGDAVAGKKVYDTYCVACHQADGTGMGGMLAANFKTDTARLAKSDAELLVSIREGITGKVGTMPPWGGSLSDQQTANSLAYIRATFGE